MFEGVLNTPLKASIEAFFFELNRHKKEWFANCFYNPRRNNIAKHLEILIKAKVRSVASALWKYNSIK